VELELQRKWREERELGTPSEVGFTQRIFDLAKKLFVESDLYEDLSQAGLGTSAFNIGGGKQRSKAGLTLDHRKEFVS
jgi:hypothetical protein